MVTSDSNETNANVFPIHNGKFIQIFDQRLEKNVTHNQKLFNFNELRIFINICNIIKELFPELYNELKSQ